jgi:hypothetical protein
MNYGLIAWVAPYLTNRNATTPTAATPTMAITMPAVGELFFLGSAALVTVEDAPWSFAAGAFPLLATTTGAPGRHKAEKPSTVVADVVGSGQNLVAPVADRR